MTRTLQSISRIQDVFEAWRELGSRRLRDGTELIGMQPLGELEGWLHAVFPPLGSEQLADLEADLETALPRGLRQFYRGCGGLILFGGVFRLYGRPLVRGLLLERGVVADDLVALNADVARSEWKPPSAVAFARNEWDGTLYVAGMGDDDDEVVRVSRHDGEVLERCSSVFQLVADKLYRLDELFLR